MENNDASRKLVAVLFPGVVQNEEKAIECLGGINKMSKIYCQHTKKRLGLSFNPQNPYVKSIYADAKSKPGVLVKVKVKKTTTGNEVKKEVVSTTVVGQVSKIYEFDSLSDFQYLPVHKDGNNPPQCILEKILPNGLDEPSFMLEPAPPFITPSHFTRADKSVNYSYTYKKYVTPVPDTEIPDTEDVHFKTRPERGRPRTWAYYFNLTDELPQKPPEHSVQLKNDRIKTIPQLGQEYETLKKIFEERPIISQNLIRYKTKIKIMSLKILLPCLAIYMKSGPWRALWVRIGYDPRKEPGARIYQTLDYRLRLTAGMNSFVRTRDWSLHYKKADRVKHSKKNTREATENITENTVYFRPGMAPSQRQIFYQYCDIKVPEVEEILAAEPPPGYLCHETRGWLPPLTTERCRDHIARYVQQTLLANTSGVLKLENSSSAEDSNSDNGGEGSSSAMDVSETFNT